MMCIGSGCASIKSDKLFYKQLIVFLLVKMFWSYKVYSSLYPTV